jgi:hypothetical protein
MANRDDFLLSVAKSVILCGLDNDSDTILYRQPVLQDCLKNPAIIRELYALSVEGVQCERKGSWGFFSKYPAGILNRGIELLNYLIEVLKKLRTASEQHAASFESDGFRNLFAMREAELTDEYFASVRAHLKEMKFRAGILISAELGKGNKGKDLVIITGANQGGKSTFLRSVGLAQMMMQAGMFVPAESFSANICPSVLTHYKREEDATMKSGKFDEELTRMSEIADHLVPESMLLFNESFAATNEREGSEIAGQIVSALLDKGFKVFFVTHQYTFASGFHAKKRENTLFLRAERESDGTRTFKLVEAEPLETSYGEDLYNQIFGEQSDIEQPDLQSATLPASDLGSSGSIQG